MCEPEFARQDVARLVTTFELRDGGPRDAARWLCGEVHVGLQKVPTAANPYPRSPETGVTPHATLPGTYAFAVDTRSGITKPRTMSSAPSAWTIPSATSK